MKKGANMKRIVFKFYDIKEEREYVDQTPDESIQEDFETWLKKVSKNPVFVRWDYA